MIEILFSKQDIFLLKSRYYFDTFIFGLFMKFPASGLVDIGFPSICPQN